MKKKEKEKLEGSVGTGAAEAALEVDLAELPEVGDDLNPPKEKLGGAFAIFSMMINPAKTLKSAVLSGKWYFGIAVSTAAFALFFLQTGLDLYKTGQKGLDFVFFSAGVGALYGCIGIPLISTVVWLLLKAFKTDKGFKWTIASLCLSYSGALVYGTLGMCFSLFLHWRTAVAFGVSGVLWAIGPMIVTVREMTGSKIAISVPVATVFSALVLLSWSYFGQL